MNCVCSNIIINNILLLLYNKTLVEWEVKEYKNVDDYVFGHVVNKCYHNVEFHNNFCFLLLNPPQL